MEKFDMVEHRFTFVESLATTKYKLVLTEEKLYVQNRKNENIKYMTLENFVAFAELENDGRKSNILLKTAAMDLSIENLKSKNIEAFIFELNRRIAKANAALIEELLARIYLPIYGDAYPREGSFKETANLFKKINNFTKNDFAAKNNFWQVKPLLDARRLLDEYFNFEKEVNLPSGEFLGTSLFLQKKHEKYQLYKHENFFNTVESNPLTPQQRLAVIRSDHRNKVLAAAGTGKTSVIVAKVIYLIANGLAAPSEILILAFNKDAAVELEARLKEKGKTFGIKPNNLPTISTFHKLGKDILEGSKSEGVLEIGGEAGRKKAKKNAIKISKGKSDGEIKKRIRTIVIELLVNEKLKTTTLYHLQTPLIENFFKINQSSRERILRNSEYTTLAEERVHDFRELIIANFLFLRGIDYDYSPFYFKPARISTGVAYRPNFQIKEKEVYVSLLLENQRNEAEFHSFIRHLHKGNETKNILISTSGFNDADFLEIFEKKLLDFGICTGNPTKEEELEKLINSSFLEKIIQILFEATENLKIMNLQTREEIFAKFESADFSEASELADLLYTVSKSIPDNSDSIDFDEMINGAIKELKSKNIKTKFKHILIDEFQDISPPRMNLVQELIYHGSQVVLTVVGDDWQAINRFAGGDLSLTTKFDEKVGSATETTLDKSFRYNSGIALTAGAFVTENPHQAKKQISTLKKADGKKVFLLDDLHNKKENFPEKLKSTVNKIQLKDPEASIAVIARYNDKLNTAKNILENSKIKFWTFHGSKGLEADYAILIGFDNGFRGFPSSRENIFLETLLAEPEEYPHAEERRLLYVGITRAKKECFIIASSKNPSKFAIELCGEKYGVDNSGFRVKEGIKRAFSCPNCASGVLTMREYHGKSYYRCSSGFACEGTHIEVCKTCSGPAIPTQAGRGPEDYICRNCSAVNSQRCSDCGQMVAIRENKKNKSKFLACTGYHRNGCQWTHSL